MINTVYIFFKKYLYLEHTSDHNNLKKKRKKEKQFN